jgi:DNA primase
MSQDKFHLSESQQVHEDQETLRNRTVHLLLDFRKEYMDERIMEIQRNIKQCSHDDERMMALMREYHEKVLLRNSLAMKLGNNVLIN